MHYDSASHVTQAVQQAGSIGDYLSAFDIVTRGIDQFPDDQNLKYLAVRAMARAGSPERANSLYGDYGLERSEDVDIASLQARIV